MKAYNTLRGFLGDGEPEDFEPFFAYAAHLRVFSEDTEIDFDELNSTLNVEPSTMRRRGDRNSPEDVPSSIDMWMYTAPVPEDMELGHHIDALWKVVEPHVDFLKRLKAHAKVDVFLSYCSNVDHAGLHIPTSLSRSSPRWRWSWA